MNQEQINSRYDLIRVASKLLHLVDKIDQLFKCLEDLSNKLELVESKVEEVEELYLSPADLANRFGVDERTIHNWAKNKGLKKYKFGERTVRFKWSEAREFPQALDSLED